MMSGEGRDRAVASPFQSSTLNSWERVSLAALAVAGASSPALGRQRMAHPAAPVTRRRLAAFSSMFRRHQCADAAALPRIEVIGLRVVARIGRQKLKSHMPERLFEQRNQAIDIRRRTARGNRSETHMVGHVDDCFQLGIARVSGLLCGFFRLVLPLGSPLDAANNGYYRRKKFKDLRPIISDPVATVRQNRFQR